MSENYFDILGMPKSFEINLQELEKKYFDLQREYHPDRFVNREEGERLESLQKATDINNAYKTLKNPLNRAEYILSLNGKIVNAEAGGEKPNQQLLTEAMEQREALTEIEDVTKIEEENERNKENCIEELKQKLNERDFDEAAMLTIKLKYLTKFSEEIRIKKAKT